MFVTKIKQKMWTQKIYYNNVKIKIEKNHHQMRNLRIKCLKNFPIQEILIYFLKSRNFYNFLIHFTLKYSNFHMDFWTNHMSSDI
jgi:hypothetical protein